MDRIDYREALFRRWWLVLVLGLVGVLVGALIPVHHSTGHTKWSTTALVGAAPTNGGAAREFDGGLATPQIIFYARESAVITAAARSAGLDESESRLESAVSVKGPTSKDGTQGVVDLTTTAGSPEQSAAFTNAYAAQLGAYITNLARANQLEQLQPVQEQITTLQNRIASLGSHAPASLTVQLDAAIAEEQQLEATPSTGYNILQPAQASTARRTGGGSHGVFSSHRAWLLIGLLGGLVLGVGLVLLLDLMDTSLRSAAQAEEAFGYRVVTEIPSSSSEELGSELPSSGSPVSAAAEAYQKLRMAMMLERLATPGAAPATAARPSERQVFLIVSPGDEPTRLNVVDNLALACAEAGQRTLVISTVGHTAQEPGITGEITPAALANYVTRARFDNIALLSLTRVLGNSGQLLTRAPAMFDAARQLCDVVIVDAPPLLAFHDGEALASVSDAVVVVGECGVTTTDEARRSGELLHRVDAPVVGVALTSVKRRAKDVQRSQRRYANGGGQPRPDRESILTAAGRPEL